MSEVEPSLPVDSRNLVVRAVEAFSARFGADAAYDVSLTKRIPVGAGLGGGSSDAAAALRALRALRTGHPSGSGFPWRRFTPLAAKLGADVPFFLLGGRAAAGGVGHRLRPLPDPRAPLWFVVVFPRIAVSTRWVYGRLRFPLTKRRSLLKLKYHLARGSPPAAWAPSLFNRLEEVVLPRVPAVARARRALLQAGCRAALMSGSGSSVFGLVDSEKQARRVEAALRTRPWDVWRVRAVAREFLPSPEGFSKASSESW